MLFDYIANNEIEWCSMMLASNVTRHNNPQKHILLVVQKDSDGSGLATNVSVIPSEKSKTFLCLWKCAYCKEKQPFLKSD